MHFAWDITFGQIVIGVPIIGVLVVMSRMYGMLLLFRMEHEILMRDWATRQTPPLELHMLPTRMKKWW